ncbi:MAG: YqaJ viral recombinase family protein [Candidatus Marithrix sp.]
MVSTNQANLSLENLYNNRYSFTSSFWREYDNYYISLAAQGTDLWKKHRFNRLTASNFGSALELGARYPNSSPMDVALDITGIKPKVFSNFSLNVMAHGTKKEPIARKWYEDTYGVIVDELGVVIPKFEIRIGASLDGSIRGTNGMIEIKCPKKMYPKLSQHDPESVTDQFYHDHISEHHYAQMQGGMEICNKDYCEYIVFATESDQVYVERVLRNQDYWKNILYPGINHFLTDIMEPLLSDKC